MVFGIIPGMPFGFLSEQAFSFAGIPTLCSVYPSKREKSIEFH
jgi:hypothetical protein